MSENIKDHLILFRKEAIQKQNMRLPDADDWRNLFRPIDYLFATSWHVRALKFLLLFLILLNLSGIYLQIRQSANWITLGNAGAALVGILVFAGAIWAQTQTWTTKGTETILLCLFLGAGGTFGAMSAKIGSNWWGGTLVGILVGVLGIALSTAPYGVILGSALGGALGGILGGALGGILGGVLGGALGGALRCALNYDLGGALAGALSGTLFCALGGSSCMVFMYYSTAFIYAITDLFHAIIFWLLLVGSFYILFRIGERLERRAQNPLQQFIPYLPKSTPDGEEKK